MDDVSGPESHAGDAHRRRASHLYGLVITGAVLATAPESVGIHYNGGNELLDYLVDPTPMHFQDGYAIPSTRPGLGIEIDARAVERAAEVGHQWRNPVWRGADGALREW